MLTIKKSMVQAEVEESHALVRFIAAELVELRDVQVVAEEIEEIAYNNTIKLLVLNCGSLRRMTSAFLSRLVSLNKAMRQTGIALRVCGMSEDIEHAFRICRLEKIIPLYATEEEALAG